MLRHTALLVFATLALLPLPSRSESAQTLLLKHQSYVGWSSTDQAQRSWKADGTRSVGASQDRFSEARRGLVYRDTLSNGSITDESGFSGRYVWHADENHFWRVVIGRDAQSAIAFDIVRSEAVTQFQPAIAGEATIGGAPCTILRIQPAGLVPVDIYQDASSGAFRRVVVAPDLPDTRVFDDIQYTALSNGHRVISGWRSGNAQFTLTSINTADVADSDLQPRASQASWTFGSDSVPFSLATDTDNSHLVRIGASVNGHSGIFLLSTNTPGIVLYDDFARQAGVEQIGTADFSPFVGNPEFAGYARASAIQIGDSVLHNAVVQRMSSPGMRLAGVLGYDFLADAVFDVNIAARHFHIIDPHNFQPQDVANSYAFPIDLTDRVPTIEIALAQGVAQPTIDTGLGGFMILSQVLRDNGLISGHDLNSQSSVIFSGVGATSDPIINNGQRIMYTAWNATTTSGSCISADRISIGPYKYENPPICFGGANVFGADGGLIGMDFLRHFNWIIDYPHSRFILTPNNQ